MDDLRTGLDSWFVGFSLIFFYPTSKSYNLSEEKRYAAAISTQSFRERFRK